jgi:hypothetical protein
MFHVLEEGNDALPDLLAARVGELFLGARPELGRPERPTSGASFTSRFSIATFAPTFLISPASMRWRG